MFKVNDCVIYPGQGVCFIKEKTTVSGRLFFKSKTSSGALILFPVSSEEGEVVRPPCDRNDVEVAFKIMKAPASGDLPRRLPILEKVLVSKFKSGSVFEIAEMIKLIWLFKKRRKISVSEVRLFDMGVKQLCEEFSIVLDKPIDSVKIKIMDALS